MNKRHHIYEETKKKYGKTIYKDNANINKSMTINQFYKFIKLLVIVEFTKSITEQ